MPESPKDQDLPSEMWRRIRNNKALNGVEFERAGTRPEFAASVTCTACGTQDSALFWTFGRRRLEQVTLICPICRRGRVRFDLSANRPVEPLVTRGGFLVGTAVAAFLVTLAALVHQRENPVVADLLEDLRERAGSALGGVSRTVTPPPAADIPPLPLEQGERARPREVLRSGSGSRPSVPQPARAGMADRPPGTGLTATRAQTSATPADPRPVDGSSAYDGAADGPAVRLKLAASGDRRETVSRYFGEMEARGSAEADRLLEIAYDPAAHRTVVSLLGPAPEWRRQLSWLRGWRQITE